MQIKVVGTRPAPEAARDFASRAAREGGPAVPVQRQEVPYWVERGWQKKGNTYTGSYQGPHGAFYGSIRQHSTNDFEFLLYEPSPEIRRHSHWVCFISRGAGWFLVHMSRRPKDITSGILTVERLIAEAYGKR